MPLYDTSYPTTGWQSVNAGVVPADVFGVAINWFVNRTPLVARLPKLPTGAFSFFLTNDNYRPRSQPLTAAFTDTTGTTMTVADTTVYMLGDIVEVESEQMLLTALPSTTTATVVRGYSGTTAATHANSLPAYLIGRTGTGADVNLAGLSRIPTSVEQYCETIQHAYQVGGALQAATNYVSAYNSPLDRDRMMAIQHCMDDFEGASYYGAGQKLTSTLKNQQMKGLRALITTNKTLAPTNAAAYKPSDLIRDTVQKCFDNGGNPSLLLCSTDWLTGISIWGHTIQRVNAGATVFGTPIDLFEVPFLGGLNFLPAPLLRPGTILCLSGAEVRVRMKRALYEKPRGSRGDATEGDFIMEGAIELDNESHHAWVSGVTAFAAA